MKPKHERSLVELLQSRIDFNSGEITYQEQQRQYASIHSLGWNPSKLALLRHNQELDKRLMGYIVKLQRELREAVGIAEKALKEGGSVASAGVIPVRVWQD
jgi:hypothetical protein